jgi:hypothetical protein
VGAECAKTESAPSVRDRRTARRSAAPVLLGLNGRRMQRYDDLSREALIEILKRRDRERRLGLVWERNEIEG